MVTPQGQVKVMDFGLAQLSDRTRLTETGSTLGTPAYMSPEQAQGQPTDRRSDIWSLGVVLYEMVSGRLPFEGEREQAVLYSIISEEPEPLTALRSGLPIELDRIVDKALAKSPDERYQHVDEMLVDLRALKKDGESAASRPPPPQAAIPSPSRAPWYVALAALAVVLIAAAIWFGTFAPTGEVPQTLFEPIPLTSYAGVEEHPAFSPDGGQVVFAWNGEAQDNYDIYVTLVGSSGKPLRLTTDPARDSSPAWSPDGQQIAFLRAKAEEGSDVILIPPIGGTERKLAEIQARTTQFKPGLSWSPDGKYLAVRDRTS